MDRTTSLDTTSWRKPVAIAAGVAIVATIVYMVRRKRSALVQPPAPESGQKGARQWTADDRDILARSLVYETGAIGYPEDAAVAWVAINRALTTGKSLRKVIVDPSYTGTGKEMEEYRRAIVAPAGYNSPAPYRWKSPLDYSTYARAFKEAGELLSGTIPNPIGPRQGYCHPQAMPPDNAANRAKRPDLLPVAGRMLPAWSVSAAEHPKGKARWTPLIIGRARIA